MHSRGSEAKVILRRRYYIEGVRGLRVRWWRDSRRVASSGDGDGGGWGMMEMLETAILNDGILLDRQDIIKRWRTSAISSASWLANGHEMTRKNQQSPTSENVEYMCTANPSLGALHPVPFPKKVDDQKERAG